MAPRRLTTDPDRAPAPTELKAAWRTEHPTHTQAAWREAVANLDTVEGYWEWASAAVEREIAASARVRLRRKQRVRVGGEARRERVRTALIAELDHRGAIANLAGPKEFSTLDSLDVVELTLWAEDEFEIKLDDADVLKLSTLEQAIDLVLRVLDGTNTERKI